jgi:hypothetical protein
MLRLDRRRIASESYAFLATIKAAMKSVIDDVQAAQNIVEEIGFTALNAYIAGQRIKKTAFSDLRSTCLRSGGQLTEPFLRLDKEIDIFAGQVTRGRKWVFE